MKKFSVIITIVALMLNVISASHAYECKQDINYGKQIIKAVDDIAKSKNSIEKSNCAQCSCQHHSSAAFISKSGNSELFSASTESYSWDNAINYSQLNFPPSKPPKA